MKIIGKQTNTDLTNSPDPGNSLEKHYLKYEYCLNEAKDPTLTLAVTGHQFTSGWCAVNVWIRHSGVWDKLIPEIKYKRTVQLEMLVSACIKWLGDPLQRQWANADFRWGHAIKAVMTQIQKAQSA